MGQKIGNNGKNDIPARGSFLESSIEESWERCIEYGLNRLNRPHSRFLIVSLNSSSMSIRISEHGLPIHKEPGPGHPGMDPLSAWPAMRGCTA